MLIPEAQGGHLALTFSFVWINVISNIITVALCFVMLNLLMRVTQVRSSLLIPIILLLIYLGAFAEKNAFEDLALVLLFGVLGWVLQRLDWPRPPLILGVVLGPLAEKKLFLSIENYGLAWLSRPGVLLLIGVILAGLFSPLLKRRRRRGQHGKEEPPAHNRSTQPGARSPRVSRASLFDLFIVIAFICALWKSTAFDFKTGLFPWVTGFSVLALATAQLLVDLTGERRTQDAGRSMEAVPGMAPPVVNRRTASIFGWIFGYCATIWLLGFSIGGPLSVFVQLKLFSREKWAPALMLTALAGLLVYGLFDLALHLPFPPGQLFLWLGIS